MEANHGNIKGLPVKNQHGFSDQRKIEKRNLTQNKTGDAFGDDMYQTKQVTRNNHIPNIAMIFKSDDGTNSTRKVKHSIRDMDPSTLR